MNITEAKKNVANIENAIAELNARIASETEAQRDAVAKRDNLAVLLASGEVKPDQIASVQAEPDGYAAILSQLRRQHDELTRALDTARLEAIAAEAESGDSPLLTHADRMAMIGKIMEAMTPALTAYVDKVKAHNVEYNRIYSLAPRRESGAPVFTNPSDPMKQVQIGERAFAYYSTTGDRLLMEAITTKLNELR